MHLISPDTERVKLLKGSKIRGKGAEPGGIDDENAEVDQARQERRQDTERI